MRERTDEGSAVSALADELHRFEDLLSAVFDCGGRLASAAIGAQRGRNLSGVAGHQVLAAISGANAGIGEAISRSAEVHKLVERLGRQIGIDVEAYGDEHEKPGPGTGTGAGGIQALRAAA